MSVTEAGVETRGLVFDVDTFAVHDGPGIRLAVYLKGCPLSCLWCHSPESQSPGPEVIFVADRCALCGGCAAVCARSAHSVDASNHVLRRDRCVACGRCIDKCPTQALQLKGRWVTVDEIVSRARRMKPFFAHSGGGITLTGGEVTGQASFAEAVLRQCQADGIHTAIETCGAASWGTLDKLVRRCDLVLYDLKLIDDCEHRRWTGASNRQVLENARRLAGHSVQVRVPLIPGVTDSKENLGAIASFMREAGLRRIALLPYNPSAGAKYEWLGRCYDITAERQTRDQLRALLELVEGKGLDAEID